jgi:isocitrate dehydrogenase
MTKDLALLVGGDQGYLTTQQFMAKLDENLQSALNLQSV